MTMYKIAPAGVLLCQTLFAVVTYPLHISGGSGRFTGATVDLSKNATVFRYTGRVCFEEKD